MAKQEKPQANIAFVLVRTYTSSTKKKGWEYEIVESHTDKCQVGQRLSFGSCVVSLPVGGIAQAYTEDGGTFNNFRWYMGPNKEDILREYDERISEWSIAYRLKEEEKKAERDGKKKPMSHIDSKIDELVKSTKNMTVREKLQLINYITRKVLQ